MMPEQRPETGGLLLPPFPYVCPLGMKLGPSGRQTGRCTLAANSGIRLILALLALA